jgi:hypothetical protein
MESRPDGSRLNDCRQAETCFSLYQRGTYGHGHEWITRHAEAECGAASSQDDQARHHSIGRWAQEDVSRDVGAVRADSCSVPWIYLEPESGGLLERWESTQQVMNTLEQELGADLSTMMGFYSGNQSIYTAIPCGQFGPQMFESADAAEQTLNWFADRHFSIELDRNLFDPFHLVRTPGSRHEHTGKYVVSCPADEMKASSLKDITEASKEHRPARWPNPWHVDSSGLEGVFDRSVQAVEENWVPAFEDIDRSASNGAGGVAKEIEDGVGKGEAFQGRGTTHHGRNKATYIMACRYLDQYSEEEALRRTEQYAKKHSPPLGDHPEDSYEEYKKCFESAKRTV